MFLFSWVLFLSSFAIALGLVGVRLLERDLTMAVIFFVAAAASTIPAMFIGRYQLGGQSFSGTVQESAPVGEAVAGYLVSYVLPVILVEPRDSSDVAAVVIFIGILSAVYARAELHYLNPLLPLVGYRVWMLTVAAEDARRHRFVAVSRASSLALDTKICIVGDGAVRYVRVIAPSSAQASQPCG